jgi:phage I-like protein
MDSEFKLSADDWFLIEAFGEHPNRAANVVQVIDVEGGEAIVAAFKERSAQPGFAGVPIDLDHLSGSPDHESRAYGWVEGLEARVDGIYARIRWTAAGRSAVESGEYRFFSTEYNRADAEELPGRPGFWRPLVLHGLALTNQPNNRIGQRPITNRFMNASSTQPNLSPEQASRQLTVLAHREIAASRCSFSKAWRTVCNRETSLVELSRHRNEREAERAAEQARADARRTAAAKLAIIANSAPGNTWSEQWHVACMAHPDLLREASGK